MITLSCGVLVFNDEDEILLGHATGQPWWDIPKGRPEVDETPLETAVREAKEEFGLSLELAPIHSLGRMIYKPGEKDLYLFSLKVPKSAIVPERCACTTRFIPENGTTEIPEMDAYCWVALSQLGGYCAPRMEELLFGLVQTGLVAKLPVQDGILVQ